MDRRRAAARANGGMVVLVTAILVVTATCAVAIHRAAAAGDVASVAFVAVSYGALLLLHACTAPLAPTRPLQRRLKMMPLPKPRVRLRRRVWALSTLPTALFAWKVAGVVPWLSGVLVWAAAAATAAAGFFALVPRRRRR